MSAYIYTVIFVAIVSIWGFYMIYKGHRE